MRGCVPWRKREIILRTIHQFLPLIVSMMKMKLPLLTVLWKEKSSLGLWGLRTSQDNHYFHVRKCVYKGVCVCSPENKA